jgi:hypothetical protein
MAELFALQRAKMDLKTMILRDQFDASEPARHEGAPAPLIVVVFGDVFRAPFASASHEADHG